MEWVAFKIRSKQKCKHWRLLIGKIWPRKGLRPSAPAVGWSLKVLARDFNERGHIAAFQAKMTAVVVEVATQRLVTPVR